MFMSSLLLFICTIASVFPHSFNHSASSNPLPPEQDQCRNVDASEPNECPNHIGPPCPPCYTNNLADYARGDSLNYSSSTKQSMQHFMQFYINWWHKHYPPSKIAQGYNIFTGAAGRGQIFLKLYNYTRNESYLSIANAYVESALLQLPQQQQYGSYMFGHIGVWTLAAVIEGVDGNSTKQQYYLNKAIRTFETVHNAIKEGNDTVDGIDLTKCGLDEGLSGMLYAALFINKYYESEVISIDIIATLTFYILDYGIKTGQSLNTNYLQYECPFIKDCYLWGPGHGATGVIYIIYTAYHHYPTELAEIFSNKYYYDALKNTLDFFIGIQLKDGNMPTNVRGACHKVYGNDSDARVQWCHGAPGFVNVFSTSAALFADNETASQIYLRAALTTANVTFERGLLAKGTMYCHGIGGNINMLWDLGHKLKRLKENKLKANGYDLDYLMKQSMWRAKQFVLWTLNWMNINHTRIYDSNEAYSMYQGNFALPMTYIQMLSDKWPFDETACQPGWNLCL